MRATNPALAVVVLLPVSAWSQPVTVSVARLEPHDLELVSTQPATAEAFYEADLGAKVSGYVSELLVEEGFEAISASNGADAVALAKARAPDLVVCDVAMPLMDGHQVLSALRAFIWIRCRSRVRRCRSSGTRGAVSA